MGAYGSPEHLPDSGQSSNNYSYNYGNYNDPYRPKNEKKKFGCLSVFIIAFGSVVIALSILWIYGGQPELHKTSVSSVSSRDFTYSQAQIFPPLISSSVNESTDYLQGWVKTVVLKSLMYPDTAQFSNNLSDWNFSRDGDICTVSSFVNARGKETKQMVKADFIVKLSYDSLNAQVIYISVGGHVAYDISSSK